MDGILFRASGNWAHFRKPETNKSPLTHDFITKTALLGLIGAVLGKERKSQMCNLYPEWSQNFLYSVQVESGQKQSHGFTLRDVFTPSSQAPKAFEILHKPSYIVALGAREAAKGALREFSYALQNDEALYTPLLGLHNCPAELELLSEATIQESEGEYQTCGFVRRTAFQMKSTNLKNFRVGVERIPTYQNNEWWNPPQKPNENGEGESDNYAEVIYPLGGGTIAASGQHFIFIMPTGENQTWCLI